MAKALGCFHLGHAEVYMPSLRKILKSCFSSLKTLNWMNFPMFVAEKHLNMGKISKKKYMSHLSEHLISLTD